MLFPALFTVDRPALRGLEWHFTFLSTVRADGFVHLSGAAVETASISIPHFLHFFSFGCTPFPFIKTGDITGRITELVIKSMVFL